MQLEKELRAAGAGENELRALLSIAGSLSFLTDTSPDTFISNGRRSGLSKRIGLTVAGSFAGVFLLVVSRAATPTSWLYPVQKVSDAVVVDLHPAYRAHVMMRRARQVNQLVARHADSATILATLADYTHEANSYQSMPHANYAALQYCESNLRQAAATASPHIKQAIVQSLNSLEST